MLSQTLTCQLNRIPLTTAVLSTFKKNYEKLKFEHIAELNSVRLDLHDLTEAEQKMIHLDIQFFERNPSLPLENLCSHLENYIPQNESQKELLHYAFKLIELDNDSMGAGLFMHGEAGIGKSHIAIGMSKQFMARGLNPQFQIAEKYMFSTRIDLHPGQVWVIDDMNSGFHVSSRLFKQVVINAHERGGRVFVTSNKDYDELMNELFVGDSKANKIRYMDRTKGMFKILPVEGESYRQAHAWYK